MEANYTEEDTLVDNITYGQYTVSDYQVGDTIDLVDTEKYRELVNERLEEYRTEIEENDTAYSTEESLKIRSQCMEELAAAGEYKTYTIEGIVEQDSMGYGSDAIELIVPLEQYFTMTGLNEDNVSGMKFHVENNDISNNSLMTIVNETSDNMYSDYVWILQIYIGMRTYIRVIAFIAIFIMTISAVNIINTAAGNIHLRKKEFAQLRVIGMSKNRLIYTVLLEGIATTIGANVVGIAVGLGISYYVYRLFRYILAADFAIPWLGILIGFVASALLFCGSVYAPLKGLSMNMAQDLTTDGD
jgi:ABC-type lipoprotein release transport system permease subunit